MVLQIGVRALDKLHDIQNDERNRLRHGNRFRCSINIGELKLDHFMIVIIHSSQHIIIVFGAQLLY